MDPSDIVPFLIEYKWWFILASPLIIGFVVMKILG